MLLSAIVLAVGIVVVMLILSCVAMMKDCNEAQEELHEQIEQFYRVALSVRHTGDECAEIAYRKAQPFRQILLHVADDAR
jgi:hypothetical protein